MPEDMEFVLDQLADESRQVRTLNLSHLSDLSRERAQRFRSAWLGLAPGRRTEVVGALVEQAEANIHLNFHMVLRECLADPHPEVRRLAIEGLWEDERLSLVPFLMRLLADESESVRAAAATSLGRFVLLGVYGEIPDSDAARVESALRNVWRRPQETTEVRRRVLESLSSTNADDVLEMIGNAYYHEEALMRQSAIFAMGRSADQRWARPVLDELVSPDAAMRYEAATAAGELALRASCPRLIRLLDDADSAVREAAAMALGKIGGRDARRALRAAAASSDIRLADAANEALEELTFNSDELENRTLIAQDEPEDELDEDDEFDDDDDSGEESDEEREFDEFYSEELLEDAESLGPYSEDEEDDWESEEPDDEAF